MSVPNSLGPIIVNGTLVVAGAILVETALSFLGFGIQPPDVSLGNLISDGVQAARDDLESRLRELLAA